MPASENLPEALLRGTAGPDDISVDTAQAKLEIMEACGIKVTKNPSEMARLLKAML